MKHSKAMEYVNKLIFGLQRARTASRESLENMGEPKLSQDIIDGVLEDLTPWLHGEKGDALLNGLIKVSDRGRVTGMEFFNFMYIIHHLDPTLQAMAGTLCETTFPEPDIHWCAGLEAG
jgi:hypothetical protein